VVIRVKFRASQYNQIERIELGQNALAEQNTYKRHHAYDTITDTSNGKVAEPSPAPWARQQVAGAVYSNRVYEELQFNIEQIDNWEASKRNSGKTQNNKEKNENKGDEGGNKGSRGEPLST